MGTKIKSKFLLATCAAVLCTGLFVQSANALDAADIDALGASAGASFTGSTVGNITTFTTDATNNGFYWARWQTPGSGYSMTNSETANYVFSGQNQTFLNYDISGNNSVINGLIQGSGAGVATSTMLLVNPNGIIFNPDSTVINFGTFQASAMDIDNCGDVFVNPNFMGTALAPSAIEYSFVEPGGDIQAKGVIGNTDGVTDPLKCFNIDNIQFLGRTINVQPSPGRTDYVVNANNNIDIYTVGEADYVVATGQIENLTARTINETEQPIDIENDAVLTACNKNQNDLSTGQISMYNLVTEVGTGHDSTISIKNRGALCANAAFADGDDNTGVYIISSGTGDATGVIKFLGSINDSETCQECCECKGNTKVEFEGDRLRMTQGSQQGIVHVLSTDPDSVTAADIPNLFVVNTTETTVGPYNQVIVPPEPKRFFADITGGGPPPTNLAYVQVDECDIPPPPPPPPPPPVVPPGGGGGDGADVAIPVGVGAGLLGLITSAISAPAPLLTAAPVVTGAAAPVEYCPNTKLMARYDENGNIKYLELVPRTRSGVSNYSTGAASPIHNPAGYETGGAAPNNINPNLSQTPDKNTILTSAEEKAGKKILKGNYVIRNAQTGKIMNLNRKK